MPPAQTIKPEGFSAKTTDVRGNGRVNGAGRLRMPNTFYVETRSLSDDHDRVITKTQSESARDAVAKIKRQHAASGADNRDFTYTINPHSNW